MTDRDERIDRLYRAHKAAAESIAEFGVPDGEREEAVERAWAAVLDLGPDPECEPAPASPGSGDGEIGGLLAKLDEAQEHLRTLVLTDSPNAWIEAGRDVIAARRAVEEYVRGVERERDEARARAERAEGLRETLRTSLNVATDGPATCHSAWCGQENDHAGECDSDLIGWWGERERLRAALAASTPDPADATEGDQT